MAHLGRRLKGSVSVTIYRLLPSTSHPSSYHLNHSDSALPFGRKIIKMQLYTRNGAPSGGDDGAPLA